MNSLSGKLLMTERIVESAEKLFRQLSFSGVRMEQISDRMGISRKTLYNHFPGGKRDIWKACIHRRVEEFTGQLMSIVSDTESDYIDRADCLLETGRAAMAILYGPGGLIPNTEEERLFFPGLKKRYTDALRTFFEEGTRRGYVRKGLPLKTLSAALVVLISEWRQPESPLLDGECRGLPEFVEEVLFDGILADKEQTDLLRLKKGVTG